MHSDVVYASPGSIATGGAAETSALPLVNLAALILTATTVL